MRATACPDEAACSRESDGQLDGLFSMSLLDGQLPFNLSIFLLPFSIL
jgi:hypothetical protein